jgi:beta-glucanase (GH16 family)
LASIFIYKFIGQSTSLKNNDSKKKDLVEIVDDADISSKQESTAELEPTIIDNKWILVWHEDFDDFDASKWNKITKGNNYNNELQYYLPQNVQIKNGKLYLVGKREKYDSHQYTSGKITTEGKFEIQYGKIEVIARTTGEKGSFPAIWLLPTNGETFPEVDIYESIGRDPNRVYYVNHWKENDQYHRSYKDYIIENPYGFHKYAIEWSENEIKWFVDDKHVFTSTEGIPNQPMFLIINLAIGGTWPKSPDKNSEFSSYFIIEDLKVMKRRE